MKFLRDHPQQWYQVQVGSEKFAIFHHFYLYLLASQYGNILL